MTIKSKGQDKNPGDDWHLSNSTDEELYIQAGKTHLHEKSKLFHKKNSKNQHLDLDLDLSVKGWDNGKQSGEYNNCYVW